MAFVSIRQMLEPGLHFGHQTQRWNRQIRRFIFGDRTAT